MLFWAVQRVQRVQLRRERTCMCWLACGLPLSGRSATPGHEGARERGTGVRQRLGGLRIARSESKRPASNVFTKIRNHRSKTLLERQASLYCYSFSVMLHALWSNSPRPHRQGLYPHHGGLNVPPESDHTNHNTQNIHNIISVRRDIADATSLNTSVLLWLKSTGEGLRYQRTLEEISFGWVGWRYACCCSEHIDGFEDKVARERAAEVGDAVSCQRLAVCQTDEGDLRSEQRHVCATDERVRDLRMESTDGYKHDCIHKGRQHMLGNDQQEKSR